MTGARVRDGIARDEPDDPLPGTTRVPIPDVEGTTREDDPPRDGTARVFEDRVGTPAREPTPERDGGGVTVAPLDPRCRICERTVAERSDGRVPIPRLARASGTTRVFEFDCPMPRLTAERPDEGGVACVPDLTTAFRSGRRESTLCGAPVTIGEPDCCAC